MKTSRNLLFLCLTAIALFSSEQIFASNQNPFGNIPKLFAQLEAETPSLKNMKREDITPELTKKIMEQTEKTMTLVKEEAPKIIGNKIPFSGNPSPMVEVTDCVISNAERNLNECRVEVKVLYKTKDNTATPSQLYAVFVDNSGNLLHYAKFRTTMAGEGEKSSNLFLQLPRINLTNFKEIRFVTDAELKDLIAKAK